MKAEEPQQFPESLNLFLTACQDVISKKVSNINPTIFRTFDHNAGPSDAGSTPRAAKMNPNRPEGFVQKVPDRSYKQEKRTSVFQKVDLSVVDYSLLTQNTKSEEELAEVTPLLKGNFLTKNLTDSEIQKVAGVMQKESFKKGDMIIRYGDIGQKYYVLAKGNVKVTVYTKGTDAQDPNLDSKI